LLKDQRKTNPMKKVGETPPFSINIPIFVA